MNSIKRMEFLVLYAVSICMVFHANAMHLQTYGSKKPKGLSDMSNVPTKQRLEFTKQVVSTKRPANTEKENDFSKRQKIEEKKENAKLEKIRIDVAFADGYKFEERIMTPQEVALDRRESRIRDWQENKEKYQRETVALFASLREEDDRAVRAKKIKQKQEVQAALAKKIQEEKNKEYEEDKRAVMIATQEAQMMRAKRREAREKEKNLNPNPVKKFDSKYAQNLMILSEGKALKDSYSALFMQIAEGNYEEAIPHIKWGSFSDCPNILALEAIGTSGEMVLDPQVVYEQLHRNVAKIGADFPEKNLDACALYFAKKAGNKKYLAFVQSLNK